MCNSCKERVKTTLLRDYFFKYLETEKNGKATTSMRKFSKGAGYKINLNLSLYIYENYQLEDIMEETTPFSIQIHEMQQ